MAHDMAGRTRQTPLESCKTRHAPKDPADNAGMCIQQTLFVATALVTKRFVLTSSCPHSEEPLQSESGDWTPMALSLHQDCPYIECPYKENLLYSPASACSSCCYARKKLVSAPVYVAGLMLDLCQQVRLLIDAIRNAEDIVQPFQTGIAIMQAVRCL